jgi:hypothetical protein
MDKRKCLIVASGLGDYWVYSIELVNSEENAGYLAWDLACEQYESYVGSNGVRGIDQIMDEEDCSMEDAEEIFKDEREQWIDYWYTFDVDNKIEELIEEGLIDNPNIEVSNYINFYGQK